MSSIRLDGNHPLANSGGAAIGHQGRRTARTTNALFLVNNQGLQPAVATPQAGNQHDTFEFEQVFAELCDVLEAVQLYLEGLLLNTDEAFVVRYLRQLCVQCGIEINIPRNRHSADWQADYNTPLAPDFYRHRLVIERLHDQTVASRPCSYATKPACQTGWPCTG